VCSSLSTSYTLYANGIRPRIPPYLESPRRSLLATTNSILQLIQHSLASIQSNLLLVHIPKHFPPNHPRSRHVHRWKSWATWQALSLLQQVLLQALLAAGHEVDCEVGHVRGPWVGAYSGTFWHGEHDVVLASMIADSRVSYKAQGKPKSLRRSQDLYF
jgi:hypothetical protein